MVYVDPQLLDTVMYGTYRTQCKTIPLSHKLYTAVLRIRTTLMQIQIRILIIQENGGDLKEKLSLFFIF